MFANSLTVDVDLLAADTKTPRFTFKGHSAVAKCVSVHDGDTAQFVFRIGGDLKRMTCRMLGYNCAEVNSKDPVEKARAAEVTVILRSLIVDKIVKLIFDEFDKYGRPLVNVYLDETHINKYMTDNKYGIAYDGHGEKPW